MPEPEATPNPAPEKKPEAAGAGRKVLVAEDVAIMADLIKKNLIKFGFLPIHAADGAMAIELARTQFPDAMLLDLMLPKVEGLEVLKTLKSQPLTKNIPIIVCTARADKQSLLDALQRGACDYIIKPFNIKTLVDKLKRAIEKADKDMGG